MKCQRIRNSGNEPFRDANERSKVPDLQTPLSSKDSFFQGRTIARWRNQILARHSSRVSNGPTEAVNNLVKRVKRVAFGFRQFQNLRIRALLCAGRPNWALLDTLTPR